MVAAANPLAVQAGIKVLKAGGSAIDAAVAIQAVLGLVEPQSSGLGGGAYLVYYDKATKKVTAYDGREIAPMAATPNLFKDQAGKRIAYEDAVGSGLAIGVPGAIPMLRLAQQEHGRLAWKALFADAATLADGGFRVSPRLAAYASRHHEPDVQRYFTKPDNTPYVAGDLLKNAAYATTLRRIAAEGPSALLSGSIAADIVARSRAQPFGGGMTLADLAVYRPQKSVALCRPYRSYTLCTPQLPSGGPALQELLGILEQSDIARYRPSDPRGWYIFAEASRLTYVDRNHYLGDPAFVRSPVAGILNPAYLKARADLIGDTAQKTVDAGKPAGADLLGPDTSIDDTGTSSFAVVDANGDVAVMTTTVKSIFGSGRMVDGFFLNDNLASFSFSAGTKSAPTANAAGPHKRPRSSLTPSVIFDRNGEFYAAIGSPGGTSILDYVGKSIVAMIDWKLPIDQAINLPNVIGHGEGAALEKTVDPAIAAELKARGLIVSPYRGEASGLHGVLRVGGGYLGAADPRREGIAAGF